MPPENRTAPGFSKWGFYLPDSTSNPTVNGAADVLTTGELSAAQKAWLNELKNAVIGINIEWGATTAGSPVGTTFLEYRLVGSLVFNELVGCSRVLQGANLTADTEAWEFDWDAIPVGVEEIRLNWRNSTLDASNKFVLASARCFMEIHKKR